MKISFVLFILLAKVGHTQNLLKIKTVADSITISHRSDSINSGFSIQLVATNQSGVTISMPSQTRGNYKNNYQIFEVGYEIIKNGKSFLCDYDIDYGPLPKSQIILNNQSKYINVFMLGDCFKQPGTYKIIFFVKFITGDKGNTGNIDHESCSNNFTIVVN
jgi:hypothetical protein